MKKALKIPINIPLVFVFSFFISCNHNDSSKKDDDNILIQENLTKSEISKDNQLSNSTEIDYPGKTYFLEYFKKCREEVGYSQNENIRKIYLIDEDTLYWVPNRVENRIEKTDLYLNELKYTISGGIHSELFVGQNEVFFSSLYRDTTTIYALSLKTGKLDVLKKSHDRIRMLYASTEQIVVYNPYFENNNLIKVKSGEKEFSIQLPINKDKSFDIEMVNAATYENFLILQLAKWKGGFFEPETYLYDVNKGKLQLLRFVDDEFYMTNFFRNNEGIFLEFVGNKNKRETKTYFLQISHDGSVTIIEIKNLTIDFIARSPLFSHARRLNETYNLLKGYKYSQGSLDKLIIRDTSNNLMYYPVIKISHDKAIDDSAKCLGYFLPY